MKKRQFSYSEREITEIIQKAKALFEALRLGDMDLTPLPAQTRYLPPDRREASGEHGFCPDCQAPLIQGPYSIYCHECWLAKKK